MLATIFLACGGLWWLIFGCADESHVPVTNTIIQTEQMQQQTEQQRIQAQTEQAAIHATAQAQQWHQQTERAAIVEGALTARNYQTHLFLTEQARTEQRARTERQNALMMFFALLAVVGGVVVIAVALVSNQSQGVTLPPIPAQLPTVGTNRFITMATQDGWDGWDVVEYQGREIGICYLPDETKMYQLEG